MAERRIYCVVPRELSSRLHDVLRRHFHDADVEVIVEQRSRDRRGTADRRVAGSQATPTQERRRVRNRAGRRIAERRTTSLELPAAEVPELPRRARRYADQLVFLERVPPPDQRQEDLDTARLVTRIQAGEAELFSELYLRYFDRVYSYLRVLLRDQHEAEDVAQQVYVEVFSGLPDYEYRRQPFRAWLFSIARNRGIDSLRRRNRLEVTDPSELRENGNEARDNDDDLRALGWIVDQDLVFLIERLPLAQRQVLMLTEMLGMSVNEVCEVLDRKPADVRTLKSRGLRFLRDRLTALGRAPERRGGARAAMCARQATVLRRRRFALLKR
jgi:RNA polymerase sigma-70 factor (ECF subfamily)